MIYTAVTMCTCCLAVQAGLRYGMNSSHWHLCPYHDFNGGLSGRHKIVFIDNLYTDYKHDKHLDKVKAFRPKYATVRDIMTREQCREAGIEYYEFEQILAWADELSEFAQQVILIPKYDCIERIPEKYLLGFSIPTQHGGTFVDAARFKGRKIHLLGGSWRRQLEHLDYFGDDVISVDNNQLHLIARYGQFVTPEGGTHAVGEFFPHVNNVLFVALALSFGNVAYKVAQLFSHRSTSGQDSEQEGIVIDSDALLIRKAEGDEDKEAIRKLWSKNADMLGAPQLGGLIEHVAAGTVNVATLNGVIVGFVEYHARRDNWQTIYHLATMETLRGKGIGKALFESVPRPIRLKVTKDNARAIRFYEYQGMKEVSSEQSDSGRELLVYELLDEQTLDFPL